jgi:murein DD-endopeptidase MepM/ murein hydrolase activator NlpD
MPTEPRPTSGRDDVNRFLDRTIRYRFPAVSVLLASAFAVLLFVIGALANVRNVLDAQQRANVAEIKKLQVAVASTNDAIDTLVKELIRAKVPLNSSSVLKLLAPAKYGAYFKSPLRNGGLLEVRCSPEIYGWFEFDVVDAKRGELADVLAAEEGKVQAVRRNGGTSGFYSVEIQHKDHSRMLYGRLEQVVVGVGQSVTAGGQIGRAQASSPLGLRVCLTPPDTDACIDPRPFMAPMSLAQRN